MLVSAIAHRNLCRSAALFWSVCGDLMNLTLERTVYVSEAVNPDTALLVLAEILAASDRNNRRDDVTGALLVSEGRFLQVLEGARQDLDRVLGRLERDSRHRNMTILARTAVERRMFASWTMAAARITPAQRPRMEEIIHLSSTSPARAAEEMLDLVKQQIV